MGFKKGDKKPANSGRKKGTPNKENKLPRDIIRQGLLSQGNRPFDELSKLEGKEYIECYEKLMKYAIPQLKAVEHSGDQPRNTSPFQFIIQQTPDDSTE